MGNPYIPHGIHVFLMEFHEFPMGYSWVISIRDIVFRKKIPLGCTFITVNNVFVYGPKYAKFFGLTWEGLRMIKSFSDFWYVDSFRRYSRSKSKVVKNCEKFWAIFCRHKFLGAGIVKIVPNLSLLPRGASTEKVPWGYSH